MTTLLTRQQEFSRDLSRLIQWCNSIGIQVTIGEVLRTKEQQQIYYNKGLSKTLKSKHLLKLAADLYFFVEEKQITGKDLEKIAAYWKSLSPKNVAGYYWGWDHNHFEKTL